jgi:hypothetical protein
MCSGPGVANTALLLPQKCAIHPSNAPATPIHYALRQAAAPKRVLVLGAGWAGLAAARTLLSQARPGSLRVTVLEATDQVGGRARSAVVRRQAGRALPRAKGRRRSMRAAAPRSRGPRAQPPSPRPPTPRAPARPQLPHSGPVELGATWFHGTRGNPIYDFAVAEGVVDDPERATQLGLPVPKGAKGEQGRGPCGGVRLGAPEAGLACCRGLPPLCTVRRWLQPHAHPAARYPPAAAPPPQDPTPDRWGVELARPGAAAPLAGPARRAAVAAMEAYGAALEELGEEAAAGGKFATFGEALRTTFDQV